MGSVVAITGELAPAIAAQLPRLMSQHTATPEQWAVAQRRGLIVKALDAQHRQGLSVLMACRLLLAEAANNDLEPVLMQAVRALARDGDTMSRPTLERWYKCFRDGGLPALLPQYRGRVRKAYGWEARALHLYRQPTRPCRTTVAFWLRSDGHASATDSRVADYLKKLPKNLTDYSPSRVGEHFHAQNIRPHHRRDLSEIAVGEIYVGDGHKCDVYVQHPVTGKHYRPEITVWMDMKSRRIVGWWLSENEGAHTTLYSLSKAILNHNHVPVWVYTDPGSGFKNQMMSNEALGFYARLGATHRTALAGNARGKGGLEGWFGNQFEEPLGKSFPSYCGHCRTDDALSRLESKIRSKQIPIPTLAQYAQAITRYLADYDREPQPDSHTLQGRAPADLWPELVQNPYGLPPETLARPMTVCRVSQSEVRLWGGYYRHPTLAQYNGENLHVEHDPADLTKVWVSDAKGRHLVEAPRTGHSTPWAPASVLEIAREKSRVAAVKRKQKEIDEINARARLPITHQHSLAALEALDNTDQALPETTEAEGLPPLDLFNTDY